MRRNLLIAALACALLAAAAASLMSQTVSLVGPASPARFGASSPKGPQPPKTPVVILQDQVTYNYSTGFQNAWKLEETGAAKRIDAVSANDLTAAGAPVAVAGKSGNAASLTAAQQLRSVLDNPATTTDLTIVGWFRTTAPIGAHYAMSMGGAVSLLMNNGGANGCTPQIITYDPVLVGSVSFANPPANPGWGRCDSTAWVFWTVRYTYSTKLWTLRTYGIGNGYDRLNYTAPTPATNQLNATTEICINTLNCTNNPSVMQSDEMTIWARYLPDAELDAFWNGGAGRFYPF